MTRTKHSLCKLSLGFLLLFLSLFLFWAFKDEARAMLTEPPQVCALCDQEPQDVPCLLNISTGDIGKLVGTAVPGKFQYIGVLGAMGGWDSDTQTGKVTIPDEKALFTVPLFCRFCRWTIMKNPAQLYYLADLSEPKTPLLYPIEDQPMTILGWSICPEETSGGTTLTITPAE